jgi:hypothetical protein
VLVGTSAAALVVTGPAIGGQAAAAGAPAAAVTAPATVLLPTGDRVLVRATVGKQDLRIIRAATSGPGATISTVRLAGDQYAVPLSARPYLGRSLDPSLFDVTRLSKAGAHSRLPVTVRYTGATAPAVPGVTVTKAAAGVATGYLTPSSARTFGAALARQVVADAQAGWPANSGIFARVTRIGADIAPVVTPSFPMRTLIVKALGADGKPLRFGFGLVVNADDGRKGGAFVLIENGEARVSVPLGHYTALVSDDVFTPDLQVVSHVGIVTDYSVSGQNQVLTVDTRTATAPNPTVVTPRPTRVQELDVDVIGSDALGQPSFDFGFATVPPQGRIFLTPVTTKPTFGSFGEVVRTWTVDGSVPGGRYAYDAAWEATGIPAVQRWVVPATGLSRVDSSWASDLPLRTVGTLRAIFPPSSLGGFTSYLRAPAPLHRDEFVYAPAQSAIFEGALMDYNTFEGDPGFVDDFNTYAPKPGSLRTQVWFGTPYELSPSTAPDFCILCRTGTQMFVASDLHDSLPNHFASLFTSPDGKPVAHFTVFRDGTKVLAETDSTGDLFTVPTGAANYRVLTDVTRIFQGANLSTTESDELTFRSAAGQGPAPTGECIVAASGCHVLPVLAAHLDLGASLTDGLPVGTSTFPLTVGRIDGAAPSALTAVTVQVRRSGTTAWTSLQVDHTPAGPSHYLVTLTTKPFQAGQVMDVQVLAKDAAGSTIRQTTERAFVVGG